MGQSSSRRDEREHKLSDRQHERSHEREIEPDDKRHRANASSSHVESLPDIMAMYEELPDHLIVDHQVSLRIQPEKAGRLIAVHQ